MVILFGCWLVAAGSLPACSTGPRVRELPPPEFSTTLGVNDELELFITPAKDLPTAYQVHGDGTINLPFLGPMKVVGLEPHDLEKRVRDELIKREFFTDPKVTVFVKAYRSKRVEVLGQVKKPDAYPFEQGMGLLRLISLAGGITELADDDSVTIRRKLRDGTVKVVEVSIGDIIDNRSSDILLQPGDSVNVPKSPL